ncbi:hypothetical protein LTR39_002390 [Cryomyces antarcticus]|nr:hypothetical protein LTR39_002390 [Cryomyces antarcticus]
MKRKGENPRWQDLERCAYLQAVVAEGLRVSLPAVQRMNRVLPTKPRLYTDPQTQNEWHIPPNTPVSMSAHLLHFDERVFPRPHEFLPERWLDDPTLKPTLPGVRSKTKDVSEKEGGGHGSGITDGGGKIDRELGKYIASFGYGTRICVGMKYVLDFHHGLRIYPLSFFLLAPPSTPQIIFLLSFHPLPRVVRLPPLPNSLAYAEMYTAIALLFGPHTSHGLQLQLYRTTHEDVKFSHDFVVGAPRLGTRGVRVVVG